MTEHFEHHQPLDYEPRMPQDAIDWDDQDIDPALIEQREDITEILHEDPEARKEIIDEDLDPDSDQHEDYREDVEDHDQNS